MPHLPYFCSCCCLCVCSVCHVLCLCYLNLYYLHCLWVESKSKRLPLLDLASFFFSYYLAFSFTPKVYIQYVYSVYNIYNIWWFHPMCISTHFLLTTTSSHNHLFYFISLYFIFYFILFYLGTGDVPLGSNFISFFFFSFLVTKSQSRL